MWKCCGGKLSNDCNYLNFMFKFFDIYLWCESFNAVFAIMITVPAEYSVSFINNHNKIKSLMCNTIQ